MYSIAISQPGMGVTVIDPDGNAHQERSQVSGVGQWGDILKMATGAIAGKAEHKERSKARRTAQRAKMTRLREETRLAQKRRANLATAGGAVVIGGLLIAGVLIIGSKKRRRR